MKIRIERFEIRDEGRPHVGLVAITEAGEEYTFAGYGSLDGAMILSMENMKDSETKGCPIRIHPYGLNDSIPLCPAGNCTHILLPGEKNCPCHATPPETSSWEDEFDRLTPEKCMDLSVAEDWLKETPTLYEDQVYNEPMFDLSKDKVKDFIRSIAQSEYKRGYDAAYEENSGLFTSNNR